MDYAFNSLLAPLAEPPRRTRQFSASLLSHIAVIMLLAVVPVLRPQAVSLKRTSSYVVMPLMTEYQPPKHMAAAPKVKLPPTPAVETPTVARLEVPRSMRTPEREVEPPKVASAKFEPAVPAPVAVQPKLVHEVKTGVLSEGSSAKPTVKAPAQKVQTGGFGDENGVNGEGRRDARLVIAHLGSPDLPFGGGGYGNGTGGAHGIRGTVASAGFGNGVATQAPGAGGNAREVRAGGFADSTAVASGPKTRVRSEAGDMKPVEILSKPRPVYSEEARQLKIEGEVLLDVVFGADGSLHVQRVTRGLGHGLDEAAIRAAQLIRFRPARRDGQAVDSAAILHIVFELAY